MRNTMAAHGHFWMLAMLVGSACLLLAPSAAYAQFEGCEECIDGIENPQGTPIHWFEHNQGEGWDCEFPGSGCHLDEREYECDWVHDECIPDPLEEDAIDAIVAMIASRDARTLTSLVAAQRGKLRVNLFTNTLDVLTCGRVLEMQFALPEELAELIQQQLVNDLSSEHAQTTESPGSPK